MSDLITASDKEHEALTLARWVVSPTVRASGFDVAAWAAEDPARVLLATRYLQGVILCAAGKQPTIVGTWHLLQHRSPKALRLALAHSPYRVAKLTAQELFQAPAVEWASIHAVVFACVVQFLRLPTLTPSAETPATA